MELGRGLKDSYFSCPRIDKIEKLIKV